MDCRNCVKGINLVDLPVADKRDIRLPHLADALEIDVENTSSQIEVAQNDMFIKL